MKLIVILWNQNCNSELYRVRISFDMWLWSCKVSSDFFFFMITDQIKLLWDLVHINSCLACVACSFSVWEDVHFALWSEWNKFLTEKIVPYISTFFFRFSLTWIFTFVSTFIFTFASTWIFLCIHVYFRLELNMDLDNCLHSFPHFSLHLSLHSPQAEHGSLQSSPHFSLQISWRPSHF